MREILPQLLSGLCLFLFAIFQLSEVLQSIFSNKAKELAKKYTSNTLLAIIIGIIITIILDSSSAVIIMVIVFINSKVLTFRQAMGIILGANIGTTFSSKLIALGIGEYSFLPMVIGLLILLFAKNLRWQSSGTALMYFGMLFYGLYTIETSVLPLKESELFTNWMASIGGNAFEGAFVGGLITVILQSSSATVAMAIILGKQNIITLVGGLAIMIGAELGTVSNTLIATIKSSRGGLKAGLFYLIYSILTVAIALVLFKPFVNLVNTISNTKDIGSQIANGHVIINVLGVVLCLPFLNLIEKGFNKLLPEKLEE